MTNRQTTQPATANGQAVEVLTVSKTGPNADGSAKLPYRAPRIAIPARAVARAMQAACEGVELLPGYLAGVPIVGQGERIQEAYWRDVWLRLGRPDPGLQLPDGCQSAPEVAEVPHA